MWEFQSSGSATYHPLCSSHNFRSVNFCMLSKQQIKKRILIIMWKNITDMVIILSCDGQGISWFISQKIPLCSPFSQNQCGFITYNQNMQIAGWVYVSNILFHLLALFFANSYPNALTRVKHSIVFMVLFTPSNVLFSCYILEAFDSVTELDTICLTLSCRDRFLPFMPLNHA